MIAIKPETFGFATHHDEALLFPTRQEAEYYCYEGENPIELIRLSDYEALQAECERLRKALVEARDLVAEWGDYASDYFKEKHGLERDIARLDAAVFRGPQAAEQQPRSDALIVEQTDEPPAALSGLPDSLPMEPYQTVDRGSPHYKAGWNACRRAMLAAAPAEQRLL